MGAAEQPTVNRDLGTLIDAVGLEVEMMMNAEARRLDGSLAGSRLWWELRALGQLLGRASVHADVIERLR